MRLPLSLFLLLALASSLPGQDPGRGNLGSNGREPRLELAGARGGAQLVARITDLAPPASSGVALFLLVAAAPAAVPLDALGIHGAVLGVDLATLSLFGPIPVTPSGTARFVLGVRPEWKGVDLFAQALYIDPRRAPFVAFSDSRSTTLGTTGAQIVLAADGVTRGTRRIVRYFPDGRPGTSLPLLGDLVFADLRIPSIQETRTFRDDLPHAVKLGGVQAVRLADGSVLLRYAKPAARKEGLLRVHGCGRVESVFETTAGQLLAEVHASAKFVAFVSESDRLWLYRTDGTNWTGTAESVRDATPAPGLDLEAASLVFGSRVLACVAENEGLFLVPLSGAAAIRPKLPPSGGRAPEKFDEEVAVSGDGRTFAFGAGKDEEVKDIYVVRDDGRAVNVTARPSHYAEVGYTNPGRRIQIALDDAGTMVAWVDVSVRDDRNFVSPVSRPAPRLITAPEIFKCIDIGTTARFPKKGGILVVAGQSDTSLDLFFSPGIRAHDIVPLTRTATRNAPPYAVDSKLTVFDLASVRGADPYLLWARHQSGIEGLFVVDPVLRSSRVASAFYHGLGVALRASPRVVVEEAGGVVLVDPRDPGPGFARHIALGPGSVRCLSVDPATDVVAVVAGNPGRADLWRIDPAGAPARRLTASPTDLGTVLAGFVPGQIHVLSAAGPAGRHLLRWTPAGGLRAAGGARLRYFLQSP